MKRNGNSVEIPMRHQVASTPFRYERIHTPYRKSLEQIIPNAVEHAEDADALIRALDTEYGYIEIRNRPHDLGIDWENGDDPPSQRTIRSYLLRNDSSWWTKMRGLVASCTHHLSSNEVRAIILSIKHHTHVHPTGEIVVVTLPASASPV